MKCDENYIASWAFLVIGNAWIVGSYVTMYENPIVAIFMAFVCLLHIGLSFYAKKTSGGKK